MNQRLQNYDNLKQLWDYFTTEHKMGPVPASGLLANIYAESGANPTALNPNDAGQGNDSFGLIQWNRGRRSALETFAQQRGSTADALMVQAENIMREGLGIERKGFMRGMEAETPEASAVGFAEGFIRPAAQHIPKRADYARMMYDTFGPGDGPAAGVGLQFSPEQGASLVAEEQAIAAGARPELTFGEQLGGYEGAGDIVARLFELANAPIIDEDAPEAPPTGPTRDMADAAFDRAPDVGGRGDVRPRSVSPTLGEIEEGPDVGDQPRGLTVPEFDTEIDAMFPAPEGEEPTSRVISGLIQPIAEQSAEKLNLPIEDAPVTLGEVARAAQTPAPEPEDDSDGAERKRNRRLLAADMLEALSVGLGQIGANQAVNLGPTIQGQRNRYAAEEEREQELAAKAEAEAQQVQAAQSLSQELAGMGMPGMARMALSGPEGFKQALDTYGTVVGRAPATADGFSALPQQDRVGLLRAAGMNERDAVFFSQPGLEDIASDAIREMVMPDPDLQRSQAEGVALLQASVPYLTDPNVDTAARRLAANPGSAAAMTALQEAVTKAGGDLPKEPMAAPLVSALAAAAGRSEDDPLVQQAMQGDATAQEILREAAGKAAVAGGEKSAELGAEQVQTERAAQELVRAGVLTPTEGKIAQTAGLDAALEARKESEDRAMAMRQEIQVQRTAKQIAAAYPSDAEGLFSNVRTEGQLRAALDAANERFGLPEQVKTALAASGDPTIKQALIELNAATSGKTMTDTQAGLLENMIKESAAQAERVEQSRQLVSSMATVLDTVTAEGYEVGGPLSGTLGKTMQNVLTDLFGDSAAGMILPEQEDFGARQTLAIVGQFFQNFRATGSGATSDKESDLFISAMPNITDSAIKQAGLAQRIMRDGMKEQRIMELRQEWLLEHDGDPKKQLDRAARDAYIEERLDAMNLDTYPELNVSGDDFVSQFDRDVQTGNITEATVIRVQGLGEPRYMLARDLATDLGMTWEELTQ